MTQQVDDFTIASDESDFILVPPSAYQAEVLRIDPFDGRDFNTGEPKPGIKIVFRIIGGEWNDELVDRVMNLPRNLNNEKSMLHKFFKGITGKAPEVGRNYKLRAELVGKSCTVVVENYQNNKGQTYARVASVAPPASSPRRRRTIEEPTDDDI